MPPEVTCPHCLTKQYAMLPANCINCNGLIKIPPVYWVNPYDKKNISH